MKHLSPRVWAIALVAVLLTAGAFAGIALDSWRVAVAFGVALQVLTLAAIVATRRGASLPTRRALARIERSVDNVSLRVVNESQALQRELDARLGQAE